MALGREALNTKSLIFVNVGTKQSETNINDIVADRLAKSGQRLVAKLKGGWLKKKEETSSPARKKSAAKSQAGAGKKAPIKMTVSIKGTYSHTYGRDGVRNDEIRSSTYSPRGPCRARCHVREACTKNPSPGDAEM